MAMTWTTFHRRGEVLRTVNDTVDARRDGLLPMDVAGVTETFGDELGLLGALQLRWHTRLSGRLERAVAMQPMDADAAAVDAWRATADELPGIRLVLDRYRADPQDQAMATALATAAAKEHVLLAAMAGRHGRTPEDTAAAGRALEARARTTYDAARRTSADHRGTTLLGRLAARLAA
jgi:hypothetical protein